MYHYFWVSLSCQHSACHHLFTSECCCLIADFTLYLPEVIILGLLALNGNFLESFTSKIIAILITMTINNLLNFYQCCTSSQQYLSLNKNKKTTCFNKSTPHLHLKKNQQNPRVLGKSYWEELQTAQCIYSSFGYKQLKKRSVLKAEFRLSYCFFLFLIHMHPHANIFMHAQIKSSIIVLPYVKIYICACSHLYAYHPCPPALILMHRLLSW